MTQDPKDIAKALEPFAETVHEIYEDGLSGLVKEFGKLGTDLMKGVRLVTAPVQVAAFLQDRLAGYLQNALKSVPSDRLVHPEPEILLPTLEKLKFQKEGSPITKLYIQLLSWALGTSINK